MIEKAKILQVCIQLQQEKIQRLKKSMADARKGAIDAVPSMVSWSDTTKFQQNVLADGINESLTKAKLALSQLKNVNLVPQDRIFLGAVFTLKDVSTGEFRSYFLINKEGGDVFNVEDKEITSISLEAPLLKGSMGKKKGEKIVFRGKNFEITEVQ